jgi:ferritin
MLSRTLQDALNEHLKQELYSAYLYLSMAAYCDSANLPGFARWMQLQADEEHEHAMKFYGFIRDRGGRIVLQALPQPPTDFTSPAALFEQALAHEQEVTTMIDQLYNRAGADGDHATQVFLQDFITEQVEEESTASQIVETLKMIGDDKVALLMLDRELARRGAEE